MMETFHPDLILVQDNKKRLYLCTSSGRVVFESLEAKIKQECGIKNILSFCGHSKERKIFVAGLTTANSASPVFELGLDWLCEFKLDGIIKSLDPSGTPGSTDFVSHAFSYPLGAQHKSLSSSLTSLASIASTATTLTTNSSGPSGKSSSSGPAASYTALWHDSRTLKLLAAKSEKHKTVIEVFNCRNHLYEYSIVEGANERPMKKVTSICSMDDGKMVCVDLVQNFVKFFRFI